MTPANAQDQKTLFEPVNIFNFYLDIFIKSLNEFKNLIQTSKYFQFTPANKYIIFFCVSTGV
jgi:hypothetical protein